MLHWSSPTLLIDLYSGRYVCWTAYLLRHSKGHVETCVLPGAPFSHYYQQEPSDEGIIMETDLAVKAVSSSRRHHRTANGVMTS